MSIRGPRWPGAALAVLTLLPAALSPVSAAAATHRVGQASFAQIQSDVMCVACHEPLAVANSPQAFAERQYIRDLIAQGLNQSQIEQQLVATYSTAVLARPPATGFNLLVYIFPPLVLGVGAVMLAVTLPRWKRRAQEARPLPVGPALDPTDARRLEEDLSRRL